MKKLDFSILPGWPASTDTWKYVQEMITDLEKVSYLGGTNYVVKGCTDTGGGAISPGIIVINGEVLPFEGGALQANVIVVDEPVTRAFFGGAVNNYYRNRKATFGVGAGQVAWADIAKPDPNKGVLSRLDKIEKMLKPLIGYDNPDAPGTTVYGSWLFWGRPANEIPAGWEAVPDADWKGKVPVVLNEADADFNEVGKVGGSKTHTLTIGQLPPLQFTLPLPKAAASGGVGAFEEGSGNLGALQTNSLGGGQAHNNLQPFKVVMFIRFAG